METPSTQYKQIIIFPENNSAIIRELLDKYELKETIDERRQKFIQKESSCGNIVAKIVVEATINKMTSEEISTLLKEKFNHLTKEQAEEFAKELQERIISLNEKGLDIPQEKLEQPSVLIEDQYRESIE